MSYPEYYKKYLSFLKDKNKSGVDITHDDHGNPKVVAKSETFTLNLPKYQEYDKSIENLSKEIDLLGKKYKGLCSQMYLTENATQKNVSEFEKTSSRLRELQRQLQFLQNEKAEHQLRRQQTSRVIEYQFEEYDNRQRTLFDTIDQGEPERIAATLIKNQSEFQPLEKRKLLRLAQRMEFAPIYKTMEEGTVVVNGRKIQPVVEVPAVVPAPVFGDKKTQELKKTMKKTIVKDILNDPEFNFSTIEECVSKKRLAKHYMSKEDILEVISVRDDIRARMPKGYKTLTKEALCQLIFSPR
jgi:hypothetical protein